jgi:hypothetical protein
MEERVAEVPVLKFSEAEAVAADVRERWRNVLGDEPDMRTAKAQTSQTGHRSN